MSTIIIALIGVLAGGGVWTFISSLLERKDNNNEAKDKLDKFMLRTEIDSVRCQILIMMNHYPNEHKEILELGRHYFEDLDGDWYLTSIYGKWLDENGIILPKWYEDKLKREKETKK